jgi:hypothetical protein
MPPEENSSGFLTVILKKKRHRVTTFQRNVLKKHYWLSPRPNPPRAHTSAAIVRPAVFQGIGLLAHAALSGA